MTKLKFAKGGSKAKSPVRTPDTLVSTDMVEVLLGISEGPIKGLRDGAKTFRADDTPLLNSNGNANFQNFVLDVWPGWEDGHVIKMDLGGFSNPINIGVSLAQGVPVVRSGFIRGIDAVDFRVLIQQLYESNDKGTFTNQLSLKFEVKRKTDATWLPAWIATTGNVGGGGAVGGGGGTGGLNPGGGGGFNIDRDQLQFANTPIDNGDHQTWQNFGGLNDVLTFAGDTQTQIVSAAPTAPPVNPDLPAIATVESTEEQVSTVYHWRSENQAWVPETTVVTGNSGYTTLNDGRRTYKGAKAPTDARPGDLWYMTLGWLPVLMVFNGATWVRPSEYRQNNPPSFTNGVWTIDEKVTSPTPKDIRVFLPEPGENDEWEFRVTKLSPDTSTQKIAEVAWESLQEIKRDPMLIEGVAMARVLGRASDQFTSLPQWNGDWDGRIVRVPSNYDAEARTYAGVWDGTWKLAFTSNPAFIFKDFVENNRYGLSRIYPHVTNKWNIYRWGQHCDTLVERPDGTMRPRWTFNDYVQEPRNAREMAEYIAGAAGAKYVDDGNGVVDVLIDMDTPAVMLFTKENVDEDGFNYSYTDRLTRANELTVEFVNPKLNWNKDKRVLKTPLSDADIATYGRIPENFIAVGCTDDDEAMARARRRLIGGLTEKEIVAFKTNRKGLYLSEWDVILVADPDMGRAITGRLRKVTGPRSATLRDPVTFEPGITYWATFDVVNPDYPANSTSPFRTVRRQITSAPGQAVTTLQFAVDLPALPEYAPFAIEAEGLLGFPKPYRVTNISDESGTGDYLTITALELNRNKWGFIDTGIDQGEIIYSNFEAREVLPAREPSLTVGSKMKGGVSVSTLTLSWVRSLSPWVRKYRVHHSVAGVRVNTLETGTFSVEVETGLGINEFTLIAVDLRGRESAPLILQFDPVGEARPTPHPTSLMVAGGPTPFSFNTMDASFTWTHPANPDPAFSHYRVYVEHWQPDTSRAVVRVENLDREPRWTYYYGDQLMDAGVGALFPHRNFYLRVCAVDQFGNESQDQEGPFTNPVPDAPIVAANPAPGGANVELSPPTDRDILGAQIRVLKEGVVERVWTGNQQQFFIDIPDDTPRGISAAYYDGFGNTDLNWSDPVEVVRGTMPAEGVAEIIDRLETVETLTGDIAQAVVDLENMYGDTASAAASAAAAASSAADAAAEAAVAQGKAEDAMAAAVGASASADDASQAASASAASASAASASATDAEQAASASQADRLLAETARGQAQTAATQAASSKDDAAGSAASASASAALAANSRDDAAGSASAAAGSASTANTAAGEAGVSAAAATAAQVSASTAAKGAYDQAAGLLYSAFDKQDTWTGASAPSGAISSLQTTSWPIVTDPDLGACLEITNATETTISHKGPVFGVGRRHRLRLKAKCVAPGSTTPAFRDARLTDALTYITRGSLPQTNPTAGQIVDWPIEVDTGQRIANTAGATHVRFGFSCSGTWRLSMFSVEDTTESAAAGTAASAAATSASSASASETAAGQYASAASGSATNAATSAGQALTYSNQASSSAADANAASVSAGVAASTARMTTIMSLPERMADVENFAGAISGRPETIAAFAFGTPTTDPVEGDVLRVVNAYNIVNRGWLKLAPGRTYRITVRAGVVVEGVGNQIQIGFRMLAADGTSVSVTTSQRNMALADGFIEHSFERTSEQLWATWPSAVYIRAHTRPNRNSSNVSSGATTDMAFLRLEDVTESVSAANSAAAAVTQAANASASAASAQISADLAASVGMESNPNLLPNSTFADGMTGWVAGTGWVTTSNRFGPYALTSTNGTSQVRMTPVLAPVGAGQIYTLSGDFLRTATSGAVMADIEWLNSSGGLISRSPAISVTTNRAFGAGRLSTTGTAPTGTASLQVRFYGSAWAGTALGVRQLKLEFGDKATSWRDDAQLIGLTAQLNITAATVADLDTRMASARFEVTAAAGGNLAQLKIRADTSGSLAALVAQAVSFSNTVNGAVVEVMKIISGSVYITGKLLMGSAGQIELDPTYPLILWKFGNARLAIGQLPNDSLFFWFGQGATTAITAMRKNNAKVWFDTNGNSYWGGSIIAGTISNSGQGTNTNVPAEFTLGPFGTNGGPISIVWSYDYSRQGERWGNQVSGITGNTTALVRLYRRIAGGAETLIDSMTINGDINATYDGEPVPGQPSGTVGRTFFTEYMGGSRTYTDTAGGTQQRTYRIQVVSRSVQSVPGQSSSMDNTNQRYGISSSE